MAPHIVAIIFFIWGSICYIISFVSPWTYLSFKNAFGDHLGITQEGSQFVPEYVQNQTCSRNKVEMHTWRGMCDEGSCIGFDNHDSWDAIDKLNSEYAVYYKHAILTDFSGDASKWRIVQGLLALSLSLQVISFAVYIYGTSCNGGNQLEYTTKYLALALVASAATSIGAVVVSLDTYALAHQFYTGGGYFVEGWFVYSDFVYGCDGPQYLPGPGIVMQSIGAFSMFLLGTILPCQCCTAPPMRNEGEYQPIALATPILDDEIFYGEVH